MKYCRISFRLIVIAMTLARYRVDELALNTKWLYPFRFLAYFNPLRYLTSAKLSRGERLTLALEKLGPIYIKLGQVLSTRRDLLPKDIAEHLSKLQDNVKPFKTEIARSMIEKSLGKSIPDLFTTFDDTPLASASIAQVHSATLPTGESVVVKVLRPKVKAIINRDLDILFVLAKIASHFLSKPEKNKPKEIMEEFASTLRAELDLVKEAANAATLKRNFKNSKALYIPTVYWNYVRKDVLVLERISGISADDVDAIKAQGSDLHQLAASAIDLFFTQVFEHNFFHGDLHPGNIFVSRENKQQFIAIDFGITGSLSDTDRRYIAENLIAFFKRDYARVARLHVACGWVDGDINLQEFESAIRAASEPVFEKPLKDISMGQLMLNLFRIAREFRIHIQPQLILLQKSLLNIEGMGRTLCPELDLWQTAKPYLERWLRAQLGPKKIFDTIRQRFPYWLEKAPDMPELIYNTLKQIESGHTTQKADTQARTQSNGLGLFSSGLLVASALCFALSTDFIAGWITLGAGASLASLNLFKKKH